MRRRKKKCAFCQRLFWSEPELKEKQYTCGDLKCKKERRRKEARRWRRKNPLFSATHVLDEKYRQTHREWKKGYRDKNSNYVLRNQIYWRRWKLRQSPSYPENDNSIGRSVGYSS